MPVAEVTKTVPTSMGDLTLSLSGLKKPEEVVRLTNIMRRTKWRDANNDTHVDIGKVLAFVSHVHESLRVVHQDLTIADMESKLGWLDMWELIVALVEMVEPEKEQIKH